MIGVMRDKTKRLQLMMLARQAIDAIYARHPCGCCWHIVLDDGNTERSSVQWVVEEWLPKTKCTKPGCQELAALLPRLTRVEVDRLTGVDKWTVRT